MSALVKKLSISVLALSVLLLSGCGWGDSEKATQDFFTLLLTDSNAAYAMTSQDFQSATTFEQLDDMAKNTGLSMYSSFDSTSYNTQMDNGISVRFLDGTMSFTDGSSAPIRVGWISENGDWKLLNFEFNPTEEVPEL